MSSVQLPDSEASRGYQLRVVQEVLLALLADEASHGYQVRARLQLALGPLAESLNARPGVRDAEPAREDRPRQLEAGRAVGPARPQGLRADGGGARSRRGVARGYELAEARAGGVPSEAGRRRGGGARRSGAARRRAAARAAGRVGRRAACRAGRAGRFGRRAPARGRRAEAAGGPALARGVRSVSGVRRRNADELERVGLAQPLTGCAGRAYGHGDGELVRAVERRRSRRRGGRDGRGDGAERLRQVDAAASARRAGAPLGRGDLARRPPHRSAEREGAGAAPAHGDRLRLPGVPSDRGAHRRGERRACPRSWPAGSPRAARAGPRSSWNRSGSPTVPSICRRRSRAVSGSGSRSPARSATSPTSCSPTSRPATSTAPPRWTCCGCSTACARAARRSSSSPTTSGSPRRPTG